MTSGQLLGTEKPLSNIAVLGEFGVDLFHIDSVKPDSSHLPTRLSPDAEFILLTDQEVAAYYDGSATVGLVESDERAQTYHGSEDEAFVFRVPHLRVMKQSTTIARELSNKEGEK